MKIDLTKINFMPLTMRPLYDQKNLPRAVYKSVESLILQYETDPDAIPPLLPEPFQPGKSPTVNVIFNDANGVDFMAGGGYRFAVISVAARFDGKDGHWEGNYVLAIPENNALPITMGREWLGMPKLFTDFSPIRIMEDGHLRCETSLWGHLFFGIDIAPPFIEQGAAIREAASIQSSNTPSFGYKYIASPNGPPDADYPTIMWSDTTIEHLWLGNGGEFYFGNPTAKDIGYFKPLMDALKSLPVRKVGLTAHSCRSLVSRTDKNGRIR